jgi:hypothetical protein
MTTQMTHPVVEVVDGDQQDIGLCFSGPDTGCNVSIGNSNYLAGFML